ncbi:MAG: fibrobacter succinogenes major paralogous domain-containing protein, partial [Bacteroidia bacterium]|nr:fibrobacter succinogenes major paralogous domain-containing protein [Bacteroidia bacterium]
MTIWTNEINELDALYKSFKGHLPDIVKEMEQLIRTDDANVVMLYSRRCLEVIVTDLCECELKRPRKTEPLKGIIDKLNSEEKVPSHIITSMHGLNSMSTYGTHPKDFDPEQVKPVLNNLAIIIRWYLKYKDFQITSSTKGEEEKHESKDLDEPEKVTRKPKKRLILLLSGLLLGIVIIAFVVFNFIGGGNKNRVSHLKELENTIAIDSSNNHIYKTVKIGNQVWMAENLKTTLFNDGTPISLVTDDTLWNNLKTPAYCWCYAEFFPPKNTAYGLSYNWYAVNTGKLCPTGWHVPSDAEWTTLVDYLGGDSVAGDKLKTADFWVRTGNITTNESGVITELPVSPTATNESGFTAIPGSYRNKGSGDESGFWWSS